MKFYTERPKRKGSAQVAWDFLLGDDGKVPVEMWRTHLTYYVWVMKFQDNSIEEVDYLTILSIQRRNEREA